MIQISEKAKKNQIKLMYQLLSLQGSLLTREQKEHILKITGTQGILQGFKKMDDYKTQNSFKENNK